MLKTIVDDRNQNTPESTTSEITTSSFASTTNIFRTQFFQFQTGKSWTEASNDSSQGRFVYRSYKGNLIEHELIVYVNREADRLPITRVLPVTINKGSEIKPTTVSDHCNKVAPQKQSPTTQATIGGVTFTCTPGSPNYSVLVGVVNGSTLLPLVRPDKSGASYIIYYSNLTVTDDAAQLYQIVNTFQTR